MQPVPSVRDHVAKFTTRWPYHAWSNTPDYDFIVLGGNIIPCHIRGHVRAPEGVPAHITTASEDGFREQSAFIVSAKPKSLTFPLHPRSILICLCISAQFMESIEGLATVRAFGWQANFIRQNHQNLTKSQIPFYLLFCVQRWLALVMDCLAAGFVLLLIGLILGLKDKISAGFAGVALSNVMSLSGMLTDIIMVWTEFETSLTSIERVRDFEVETPVEALSTETMTPPGNWPDRGHVEFKNLAATYK